MMVFTRHRPTCTEIELKWELSHLQSLPQVAYFITGFQNNNGSRKQAFKYKPIGDNLYSNHNVL